MYTLPPRIFVLKYKTGFVRDYLEHNLAYAGDGDPDQNINDTTTVEATDLRQDEPVGSGYSNDSSCNRALRACCNGEEEKRNNRII